MSRGDEIADQALADILELEAQVAQGEIDEERARRMRRHYVSVAAEAMASPDDTGSPGPRSPAGRAPRPWTLAYVLAATVALVAGIIVLPASIVERPEGGAVTGIEPMAEAPGDAPAVDPAAVDDEQLEQVVAENPGVIGMRLALADRYVAAGDHGAAMRHYVEAVRLRPDDPQVRTRLAWLLLTIGQTGPALENADRALALSPGSPDAAWVRANVLIDGLGDVAGGVGVLEGLLARPDLTPDIRGQVEDLRRRALTDGGGGR
ncbi:tetratricopeptide repeat protein [Pseudonocardia alni]|uniref:Cytochrome c-type biogenesis protein CcmH/NrfG n=2 Tax=Pseudonocardia alni TaxID=33907 RepID=A0AA44UVB1_PSEA5|nr:tetratricopeptide repeat protein [Pseudonocardia alni]NWJ75011.1 tetratricopeptide repeat protein [Pseudonocardia pini]NWJ75023.1 tetratricopeptide repeat protein [Pseudonocardia pini]PKB41175.1 cytochrome c-type biogenesis protein CcmH/NrfG [Pseudonocardia alni]WFG47146.1 tetratricopeptide repeat protein [Pseudonocardia alni]